MASPAAIVRAVAAPLTRARPISAGSETASAHSSRAREPKTATSAAWHHSITVLRSNRSATAPAGSPARSIAAASTKPMIPACEGEPVSARTISGSTIREVL